MKIPHNISQEQLSTVWNLSWSTFIYQKHINFDFKRDLANKASEAQAFLKQLLLNQCQCFNLTTSIFHMIRDAYISLAALIMWKLH